MTSYRYVKKTPVLPPNKKEKKKLGLPFSFQKLALLFSVFGFLLLANVLFPILSYEIRKVNFQPRFLSPVPSSYQVLGESNLAAYQNPQNWFLPAPEFKSRSTRITHYTLSIPKLAIKDAVVQIGGRDLLKGLIQYPGTALPGQYGNAVIFGHSVLPQFFNPQNYKTIFSTLPKLKKGDEILVNFDGIIYRYEVIEMTETTAEDITILGQQYDGEYLSLITCVPPGTYLRRLIVKAKLVYER